MKDGPRDVRFINYAGPDTYCTYSGTYFHVDSSGSEAPQSQSGVTLELVVTRGDALVNGATRAYLMTGSDGTASVTVTNGTVDSEITVELVPPMAPQNSCTVVGSPLTVYVWVQV